MPSLPRCYDRRERGRVDKSDSTMRKGTAIPPKVKSPVRYDRGIESDVNILPSSEILSLFRKGLAHSSRRVSHLASRRPGFAASYGRLGKGSGSAAKSGRKGRLRTRRRSLSETGYQKNTGRKKGCPTHVQAAPDSCGPAAANLPEPVVSGSDTSLHSIFRIRPR